MHDQPKYKPLRYSNFFEDGRTSRPLVPGTVARGELREDVAFYTGKNGRDDLDAFPIEINKAVIERGQQRFNIYCSPCHGQIGNGLGMIVRRGFKQPPSYHIDRLRNAPVGHFYDVISNGYGAMLNYAQQIEPRDRWAIVAYIRALQYSQNANVSGLSQDERAQLPTPGNQSGNPANPTVPQVNDQRNFPATPSVPPSVRQGKRQ
ncbi:MAG: cytochrome c [Acidobacteriota bacterium]|nr:cytochrome c [Acidobacteriota bacterium]